MALRLKKGNQVPENGRNPARQSQDWQSIQGSSTGFVAKVLVVGAESRKAAEAYVTKTTMRKAWAHGLIIEAKGTKEET